LIKLALEHGISVAVACILVILFGLVSIFRVPVQLTPDLSTQSVTVRTLWPGATPQDVEREILIEQEDYLRSIPGLEKMEATANTGSGEIVLEFGLGIGLDEILVRVNNALSQVPDYPVNVDQPSISTTNASDQPIAWFSVRPIEENPPNLDIVYQQDFLEDNIQTEYERTQGISQAEIFGGAPRQLRIYIDPAKLAERNITINQLRSAIQSRNRDVSGGDFDEEKRRYLVRTLGRYNNIEQVEGTVISINDGSPVYLRDVGYAEISNAEQRVSVRHNGNRAMAMNARRTPGTNIIEVMDALKTRVADLNEGILGEAGMVLRQVSDDTQYISASVRMVRNNLLLGGILATIILLLFLRSIPATLIGSLGVPICTIAAFLGLTIAGRTINVISLAGVAFAIGMTLDNSIVVLENIYRHRDMGKKAFQAALDGVSEVWGAVLASTLTTIFVFIPIVFVEEEAGQLFADIAIAISAAIIASMLVAITVIPTASARFLTNPPKLPKKQGFRRQLFLLFGLVPLAKLFADTVMKVVEWLMGGIIRRVVLVVSMIGMSISIVYFLTPQTEYLPEGNENLIFAFMFPPPGYNFDEMTDIGEQLEDIFVPYIDNDPKLFHEGKTDVPAIREFFFVNTTDRIIVVAKTIENDDVEDLISALTTKFSDIPGMIPFAVRGNIFSGDITGTRGIELDIVDTAGTEEGLADIFDLRLKAFGKIINEMEWGFPQPTPSSLFLGQPLLEIQPDWERAAELGIDTTELGYLVWALTDGAFVDEFFLGDDKIDMFLYSTEGTVERTQDLEDLFLYSNTGNVVPLSSVASIRETVNTETLRRVDGSRTVTLNIRPPIEIPLERAVEMVEEDLIGQLYEENEIADSIKMRIAGASDKLAATREVLGANFLLAVMISYLLMVALFAHWGYPLIIMTSLPLGIVGGIVGLFLMNNLGFVPFFPDINQPLDVITMLGFIVLIGTVVNNPILIEEQALINIRTENMDVIKAVIESTRTRIRPIMMSTMTTIFGLSPLVFSPGAGAELYRGLGTVVLFGLGFSTVFTLTFIPSVLSLFLQFGEWFHKRRVEIQERLSGESAKPSTSASKELDDESNQKGSSLNIKPDTSTN